MRLGFMLAMLLLGAAGHAQQERLSMEWILSDEGKSLESVPDRAWLNDGNALIYDKRAAPARRTLQTLNPDNGRRRDVVDAGDVLEQLSAHFEPEEPYEELGWPDAVDMSGRRVAYLKSGDIVLVELRTSDVEFITTTEAEHTAPRFSPDGSWLAYVRDNDLFAWNVEEREELRLTNDGSDVILNGTVSWVYWEELLGRTDRGYSWSPDSASIVYLQTDESGVGLMHYVDFEPQLPEVIRQRHPKAGTANPRVRAGVVRLESARTKWIDLGSQIYEYLVRIKWLPDCRRVAVQILDRAQQNLELFVADADSGEATHIFRESSDSWINVHDDLHYLPDGRFIWVSEQTGYAHAYLHDADGARLRQITAGDWSLRPSGGVGGMRQSIAHIDVQGGWMYFTAQEKSSIERHLYRIRLDGTDMSRLTGPDGTHSILFQPQGEYFFDSWSEIAKAPSLAVHRRDGEMVREIAGAAALDERFDLQGWKLFTIETDDGFDMPAKMLRPRDLDAATPYPVVVYVYGGPAAPTVRDAWNGGARGIYHQMLAESGFIVVAVDNRSAAAIGQVLTGEILFDAWGELELRDLLSAVRWLKSQPYVDADRVGIWGWSGGGTHTLQAMTRSDEFYAGVSVAPVTDWDYYDTIYAERFMKHPEENPGGYERTSHVARASELHGRLMLIHGTYDDNVHPQNSWAFADELIEAGILFEMMIYPMRKHGISDDAAQRHIYETMLDFWVRSLNDNN